MEAPRQPLTFIIRLTSGAGMALSGVVERVRTGEKERFQGVEALGAAIGRMAGRETTMRRCKDGHDE